MISRWVPASAVGLAILAGATFMLAACARAPFPDERIPKMQVLIMDFHLPPGLRETPREIRGWWLGASTIYQNPRAGTMFAERLTAHLALYPFVNLFSRLDLKYYFARKRHLLRETFDYLDDAEIDALMDQIPPEDFARELGADKVLSGRIIADYLDENRTIHWWHSATQVQCALTDVLTGRVEWRKDYRLKKFFASQFTIQQELARRVAEDLRDEYFRPLAVAATP